MSHFTAPVRRFLVSCTTAAVLLAAAAGCQSARSAYRFRPASAGAAAAPSRPAAPAQLPATSAPAPAAAVAVTPLARPAAAHPVRPASRATTLINKRLAGQAQPAFRPAYVAARQPARRGAAATDGAQATAEAGLGTTVLGVLGLVVGPISLVGLLIWGGPVWAGLLGLSALAVLVAYIDPFG